jgi:hypothetical protein
MALKAILIGPRGTVFKDRIAQTGLLNDLIMFIQRMQARGVHIGLWSRHAVNYSHRGRTESVESYLSRQCGAEVPFYRAGVGDLPTRQSAGSMTPILKRLGVQPHEIILVGNEESDMQAGVNNKLLLVRPEWYPGEHEYGFSVSTMSELAQFCELFALRQHPIFWSIDTAGLQVRSMGPFSTYIPDFRIFGADARSVAKQGVGERQFWFWMIISSLYFSGLMHQVNYISAFPGHDPASNTAVQQSVDALLTTLGKCFRKDYLPDLILRHQPSIKSQTATPDQKTFLNQINTLRLNRSPRRYGSLDVARAYIEAAGGKAILFSWLKTINMSFQHMNPSPALRPYEANALMAQPSATELSYGRHIISRGAPAEIDRTLEAYKKWKWP